ncbi:HNH endonuclease signature motif containing protein [Gordonia insulae]|uniref:DUF222 domain-containing protein n=1 Tax=Gordonia insulae TaxID=2420509 RepID=A0A3G8JSJ6_9ACTN|nr:HNH endonuclease signature motif containing protein [Gordonia insulae]AZG48081.1 hypothetical protein D7316_04694 [Gordonia insulae]
MTADIQVSEVESLYQQLNDLLDQIQQVDSAPASDLAVLAVAEEHERAYRRMSGIGHQRVVEVSDRGMVGGLGYRSVRDFMAHRLRVPDANRRVHHMRMISSLRAFSGEVLEPHYPNLAAAVAQGDCAPAHVDAVLEILSKIPVAVPLDVRESAEEFMADFARQLTPKQITQVGTHLLARIDPDGSLTEDVDRKRRRSLNKGPEDAQSMSTLTGTLDPTTRAMLEVVFAAWAAPGMNNPDDEESPKGTTADADIEKLKEAAGRDNRSQNQRNHDAFKAVLKAVLDGGLLGKSHRGLPPHLIVKVSESDLYARAGLGTTATGSHLPMKDVIELAAEAHWHLAVFKDHSAAALYLGTAKRLANQAQRLMLFAQPGGGGCSAPGCTQPSTHVEIHHAEKDWAKGGRTNIDETAPACPLHNRMVGPEPGKWSTRIIREGPDAGRAGWSINPASGPPPAPRVNRAHEVGELWEQYLRRGSISESPQPASPTTSSGARVISRERPEVRVRRRRPKKGRKVGRRPLQRIGGPVR